MLLEALSSSLGLEDMYDLIEVMTVDTHNDRVIERHREKNK